MDFRLGIRVLKSWDNTPIERGIITVIDKEHFHYEWHEA